MKTGGLLLVLVFALHAVAWAQTSKPSDLPRMPDGHPDFTGTWSSRFQTPIERPDGATSLVVSDEEARALGNNLFQKLSTRGAADDPDVAAAGVLNLLRVNGEWRTSQITTPPDGKLPFTERGREIAAQWRAGMAMRPDGPEVRMETERCVGGTGRAPFLVFPDDNMRQIVQTPDHLALYTEYGPDLRIVDFGPPHRRGPAPSWQGDMIVSWASDELVIATTNQIGLIRATTAGTLVVRPEARVVERLRLLSPNEILYRYTIEDPAIYSAPWSAEFVLNRSNLPALEYGCHEGNYAMVNILSSARASERTAAAITQSTGKAKP